MKLGITLPSFVEDPAIPIEVAVVAEAAGLDGVFVFDHVFRGPPGRRRPALECFALLGAVAAATRRVALGPLVARATLRPAATLAASFETVQRVGGGRLVAGLGAGDHESRAENESFGLAFGTIDDRIGALAGAVDACSGRGFPVWVGGTHPRVLEVAAGSDGWNRWGGDATAFATGLETVRAAPGGTACTPTWGGLVALGADDDAAVAKAERLGAAPGTLVGGPDRVADALGAYAAAGAEWAILGPVDSRDPDNARVLGEAVRPRLR